MFKTYFGMTGEPFPKDIPPQELFGSSHFKELSTRLDYLVKKRGIGLVTGEVGSGKTTAIRALCHALNPGLYKPLYLPNTTGSVLPACALADREGLTRKELPPYLKHCLNRVGITHPLFSEPAIEAIYQASKGVPRKVNLLAQASLMACAAKKAQIVDADHVREAVTETS